jgi:hypothetical protein
LGSQKINIDLIWKNVVWVASNCINTGIVWISPFHYLVTLFVIARAAGRKFASPHPSLCTRTMHGQQNIPASLTALGDNKEEDVL